MSKRIILAAVLLLCVPGTSRAGQDLPAWMQEQAAIAPAVHDPAAPAVRLLAQQMLTVHPDGSVTRLNRVVSLVLRPLGTESGRLEVDYGGGERVTRLPGWHRNASGQSYALDGRFAVDSAPNQQQAATDRRTRTLTIVDPAPGSLVGFEWETEERTPLIDADIWAFQGTLPARLAQYTLELPPGWQHTVTWRNHAELPATAPGPGRWQWTVTDIDPIPIEPAMPPVAALAAHMQVSFTGPQARGRSFQSWAELGAWYLELSRGRDKPSPEIRAAAAAVTPAAADTLARLQAVADFVQTQVRYFAIAFGIGGYQPHPAGDVLRARYGDCKDHSTLLIALLKASGIRAFPVLVNTLPGVVQDSPAPELEFNHVIAAIELPADAAPSALVSVQDEPGIGRLLYFDSTDPITPLGRIDAGLQHSYGLLVTPAGSRLVLLPQQPLETTGTQRHGRWQLSADGTLSGTVTEAFSGDRADGQRELLQGLAQGGDRRKLVESRLADTLTGYRILEEAVGGMSGDARQSVDWRYAFEVERYAQTSGDLLLLRPRVQGVLSAWTVPATDRHVPIRLRRSHDSDDFEIVLPAGYEVVELPAPVDREEDFGAYHSHTTAGGGVLHYSRSRDIRVVEAPAADAPRLRQFHDAILADERGVVVLRRSAPGDGNTQTRRQ